MEVLLTTFLSKFLRGKGNNNEGDGSHEKAKDYVADRLETGLAGGEATRINAANGPVGEDEGEVAERVEDGIGHGGEERQRTRRYGGVELQRGEDDIGGERAIDCDAKFKLVITGLLTGLGAVLLDRLEHALDGGVLVLVEAADLVGMATGAGQGGGDVTACVSLARRVGLDLVELSLALVRGREAVRIAAGVEAWEARRLCLDIGELRRVTSDGVTVIGFMLYRLYGRARGLLDGRPRGTAGLIHLVEVVDIGMVGDGVAAVGCHDCGVF